MQITRQKLNELDNLISSLKNKQFNISTQYKFLVLGKEILKEKNIYDEQLATLIEKYSERDEHGIPIQTDKGIKIKKEQYSECSEQFIQLNSLLITLPDIYFELDELQPLNLTLGELELLDPFIKN